MDHLIFAVLVFIFTTRYRTGLTGIAVFYTVCHIPGTLSMLFLFFKKFKIKFIAGYSRMKGLFFETLPVGLYVLLSTLTSRLDILFLSWMKGDADVGYYSAAYRLVYPLMFFVQAFSASLFPMLSRFYEERKDQYVRVLRMGINCILLFAVFLGISVAFNSRQIITRVYIPSYQPAIGILQILIFAVAFHFLNFYFVDIFVSARRQKIITYVMAAILFLDVILNLVLISRYGFLGAAYTRLAIAIICFFVYYYLFSRILKIKGLILYRKWIVFLILSVIWNLIFNRFHFILNTLLYAGFCAGLVFLLKIFSASEMNVLRNLFRREAEESPPSIDV